MVDPNQRALFTIYYRLHQKALEDENRRNLVQLEEDPAVRTCLRCGGDAYRDGDGWRCWGCGATEPAE